MDPPHVVLFPFFLLHFVIVPGRRVLFLSTVGTADMPMFHFQLGEWFPADLTKF